MFYPQNIAMTGVPCWWNISTVLRHFRDETTFNLFCDGARLLYYTQSESTFGCITLQYDR